MKEDHPAGMACGLPFCNWKILMQSAQLKTVKRYKTTNEQKS